MLVRVAGFIPKSKSFGLHYGCLWVRSRSWSAKDVRSKFIDYFEGQGHMHHPSSSVIPKKTDGTYFTNSGMNQFKPLFLGQCDPTSKLWGLTRAVNSQKCIRVGGKHNDLEDVGHDLTHHTFFEMLGSWSFGDYFKREACEMAHQLLTQELAIPCDRLYYTYFGGDDKLALEADEECLDIWMSLGIPRERILPFGPKDNFWDMGVTGPCGPCTEIHYDHIGGGRNAGAEVNSGSPDVVEIWNLVFMQYNRHVDQTLSLLPSQHVDTGMGLERMVAVLNGQSDNYGTDVFTSLFDIIQQTTGHSPYRGQLTPDDTAYRIMADHARMVTVAISDGLLPSNDNLGHKLRSILHKCIQLCHSHFHADPNVLLPRLVAGVVSSLGEPYPELIQNQGTVVEVVKSAISHYNRTLDQASRSFNKMMARISPANRISGEVLLDLERGHYGQAMSMETIRELADGQGLELDLNGYQLLLQQAFKHSPSSTNIATPTPAVPSLVNGLVDLLIEQGQPATDDTYKYDYCDSSTQTCDFSIMATNTSPCTVVGMLGYDQGEITVSRLEEREKGEIIIDKTCFYAEAGGQEADKGILCSQTGTFQVEDVQNYRGYVVHSGHVTQGHIFIGQDVSPQISTLCREGNMRNHTGTHLLQAALVDVLGTTQQEGSNINPHRMTFDFLALTKVEEIEVIQSRVKDMIRGGHHVTCTELTLTEAQDDPQIGWNKNEDYPDRVRVVSVGTDADTGCVSMELCGGTHVVNTSAIADFCITGLTSKSQHVQRMTCVTGPQALQAHVNGEMVDFMCQLLRRLHTYVTTNTQQSGHTFDTAQKLSDAIQQTRDRCQRTLSECSDVMEETREDVEKMMSILNSLHNDLQPLWTRPLQTEGCVAVMKSLVNRIHQAQHLDLLPKTCRHTAHICVEDMEHRVTTLLNAGKADMLRQMLTGVEAGGSDTEPNWLTVDPDLNPRQALKVVTRHKTSKPLVLVQEGKPVWTLLISVPSDGETTKPEQDAAQFLDALQEVGSVKGKLASKGDNRFVIKSSIRGSNSDQIRQCVQKWWRERRR